MVKNQMLLLNPLNNLYNIFYFKQQLYNIMWYMTAYQLATGKKLNNYFDRVILFYRLQLQ